MMSNTHVRWRWPAGMLAIATSLTLLTGTPAAAVAGGGPAADGALPFVAKIDVGGVRACTGALIDPRWVITARSCFAENGQPVAGGAPPRPTSATIGRTDLSSTAGRVATVVAITPHPDRDIVVARLAAGVFDIPPVPIAAAAAETGEVLEVAGFGRTATEWVPDRLQTGLFTVDAVGVATLDLTGQAPGVPSTCKGDAGGPALRRTPDGPALVAVHSTSWQGGCLAVAGTRREAVETRVDDIGEWIRRTVTVPVNLIAGVNGRFVTAENAGAAPLVANRTVSGPWEAFDLVDAGGGEVALMARINGRYVTAERAGADPLIANRTAIGPWERFRIIPNTDGTVSLLAAVNGRYVTAERAGEDPLIASRPVIGPWEKFTIR